MKRGDACGCMSRMADIIIYKAIIICPFPIRCNDGTAENCEERGCREEMDNRNEASCDACSSVPRQLVCGPDGLNYPSRCAAMHCGGFNADEIANRPCSALVSSIHSNSDIKMIFLNCYCRDSCNDLTRSSS